MPRYHGVDAVAREVKKRYLGVDGVAREVKTGYRGVDGVARQYWRSSVKAGDMEVGSSVFLEVDGSLEEFIVVHQGYPGTNYDVSCDGTWLLMKTLYTSMVYSSSSSIYYSDSNIHTQLNSSFLGSLDPAAQERIKTVTLPYVSLTSGSTFIVSQMSAAVFIPSLIELGFTGAGISWAIPTKDGSCWDYFSGITTFDGTENPIRVAYSSSGIAQFYWTRSARRESGTTFQVFRVARDGSQDTYGTVTNANYVRPAFILDSETEFDPETNTLIKE